jgi:hypothetical protein
LNNFKARESTSPCRAEEKLYHCLMPGVKKSIT